MDFAILTVGIAMLKPLIAAERCDCRTLIQLFLKKQLEKKYYMVFLAILLVIVVGFIFLSVYKGVEIW